jgi:hypothetical protein
MTAVSNENSQKSSSRRSFRRRAALAAGALPLAAAMAIGTTGVANAYITGTYADGVYIRSCANTSCGAYGEGYTGQVAHIYCFVSGQSIDGWPYWDENYDATTKVHEGYSSDLYMEYSGAIGHC